MIIRKQLHLPDGNRVQFDQSLFLRQSVIDKKSIQIFQIRQADQLGYIREITDIAFLVWITLSPLFGGHPEQGHIQHIRFVGIHLIHLLRSQLPWNQILFDCARMNTVVNLRQISLDIPSNSMGLKF